MRNIKILFTVVVLILSTKVNSQSSFTNPILNGSYPDPSICRVGEYFYIVNSTFEYFPGLPIHRSKDLVNWELIGYGLHREEQCNQAVNLVDVQSDGGIHAPTIRYHKGKFFVITTNVYYHQKENKTDFVNFIITAENPAGPWSEPHVLEGAPGIDPDIFFDEDGRVWYVGTHSPEKPNFQGEGEIWLQEIDLEKYKLIGERTYLWRGACDGVWAEGPHMYKQDGRYYLMIAEGGTSYNHAVMIAVSDNIRGPFISNERNPIFTTRHLSYNNWVHSTGHADLVQLEDGRWFMTALGVRGDENRGSNMGRETHLLPVTWEREPFEWKEIKYTWPVVAPITGKVERVNPVPFKDTKQYRNLSFYDNFENEKLNLQWCFRRVPRKNTYSLTANEGNLRLYPQKTKISNRERYSFVGIRQTETNFEYQTKMKFDPDADNAQAGIAIIQKDDNYISYTVTKKADGTYLQLKLKAQKEKESLSKEFKLINYEGGIQLKIKSIDQSYIYSYIIGGVEKEFTTSNSDIVQSKGYTGAYLGLYNTGTDPDDYADFEWVNYKAFEL